MTSGWTKLADASDLGEGEVMGVEVSDTPIALYRVEGAYFATHDICTHGQAKLSEGYLEGCFIECPLHAGLFDVRTGQGAGPPVTRPVRSYPVKIEDGCIMVDLG